MLASFFIFASITFFVLGGICLYIAISHEDFEALLLGAIGLWLAFMFLGDCASTINSSGSDEWFLKEEAFLAPVSDNCYLLEGETNYIYQ